jgi:ATP-dependent exoDNAse (exonuclease V) beta subunit
MAATYDPERVARAARAFAAQRLPDTLAAVRKAIKNGTTYNSIARRIEALHGAATSFIRHERPPRFLAEIDGLIQKSSKKDAISYLFKPEHLPESRDKPGIGPLLAWLEELVAAAVPLPTAVAQRFGPPVEQRLRARKRAAGFYDFDDMLALVDEALRGPHGAELAAALRKRYRLAVIDEFQDTDPFSGRSSARSSSRAAIRDRSTWSAIPSRRSTASGAPTSAPTTRRAPRSFRWAASIHCSATFAPRRR